MKDHRPVIIGLWKDAVIKLLLMTIKFEMVTKYFFFFANGKIYE